jgi:hypothetical protein
LKLFEKGNERSILKVATEITVDTGKISIKAGK